MNSSTGMYVCDTQVLECKQCLAVMFVGTRKGDRNQVLARKRSKFGTPERLNIFITQVWEEWGGLQAAPPSLPA